MILALNNLRPPKGANRSKKRLGRGNASGHGTYSTRGIKGQRARQGGRKGLVQFGVKHFVSHLPKNRGFTSLRAGFSTVTIADLAKFKSGSEVTPAVLKKARLIRDLSRPVKLIGKGNLTVKLSVRVQACTPGARVAVEAAGGSVELSRPTKE